MTDLTQKTIHTTLEQQARHEPVYLEGRESVVESDALTKTVTTHLANWRVK